MHPLSFVAHVCMRLPSQHCCGGTQEQLPTPSSVKFVYLILAENGTAGSVELYVEIGQAFTGQGMMLVSRFPPQHGDSAQAYRTPVTEK
eukprot:m.135538 g.135538  ORF g.135538 m.135538 type:complete len:89 (-) comp29800_c0_seq1:2399-2665(-)